MTKKKFLVVVNPQSGKGKGLSYGSRIQNWLKSHGEDAFVALTSKDGPRSAYSLGKMAAQEGVEVLVGVGGDGTLNLLVSGMMDSEVPLQALPKFAIVRMGTGNNFAKNIGIPSPLFFEESMLAILEGHTSCVDLGVIVNPEQEGKRYFINVASFGFDAEVVRKVNDLNKNFSFLPKDLTYLVTAGQEILSGFSSHHLKISSASKPAFEKELVLLAVLNGASYGGIFQIAPGASMTDGLLDVCLIDKVSTLKAVDILLRATKGSHVALPEVEIFRTSSLTVSCEAELIPCEIDGEVMLPARQCQISVLPKALKVLTPAIPVESEEFLMAKAGIPECQSA